MISAFIPARQGSERLPNKNMRSVAGVSLASLSVIQALDLSEMQSVVFSTDSKRYAETVLNDVEKCGYSADRLTIHYRDAFSAGSQSKIFDVLQSLADEAFFDTKFVALMLPTAPLRRRSTADTVIKLARDRSRTSFTACPYDFHVPFAFRMTSEHTGNCSWRPLLHDSPMLTGATRSQDQVQYMHPHGGFAVSQVDRLMRQRTIYDHALPVRTTRTEGLDVDVREDLDLVRCVAKSVQDSFPFLPQQD